MRTTLLACALGCLMALPAQGALISVGNYNAAPGGALVIPVMISGGESLTSLSLAFGIGDGGPTFDGVETISVSAADFTTGTIWPSLLPSDVFYAEGGELGKPMIMPGISLPRGVMTNASGLLCTLTLDLSTATAGEVLTLDPNFASLSVADNSELTGVPLQFSAGTLTIVPEPSTLALFAGAAVAGLALLRRRMA